MIPSLRHRLLRRAADERGSTLIELLVAIPAALVVAGATMALTGVFARSEQVTAERTAGIQAQQVAFDRMTREIRQARAASASADGRVLTITAADGASQVRFDCTGTTCRRHAPPTATPGRTVIEGISTGRAVFVIDPARPNFVTIGLQSSTRGMVDGVELVNYGYTAP